VGTLFENKSSYQRDHVAAECVSRIARQNVLCTCDCILRRSFLDLRSFIN
jgi:hypothetical protein